MRLQELLQKIALNHQGQFPQDFDSYLDHFIPQILLKSETLQKAFSITNEELEAIYGEGYNFYKQDRYIEAADCFRWLVILNPLVFKYWMGFAAAQQLLNKQEKALHAYAIAALLDTSSPYPHFHASECYFAMNNRQEGEGALINAEEKIHKSVKSSALKERIETLRGTLSL